MLNPHWRASNVYLWGWWDVLSRPGRSATRWEWSSKGLFGCILQSTRQEQPGLYTRIQRHSRPSDICIQHSPCYNLRKFVSMKKRAPTTQIKEVSHWVQNILSMWNPIQLSVAWWALCRNILLERTEVDPSNSHTPDSLNRKQEGNDGCSCCHGSQHTQNEIQTVEFPVSSSRSLIVRLWVSSWITSLRTIRRCHVGRVFTSRSSRFQYRRQLLACLPTPNHVTNIEVNGYPKCCNTDMKNWLANVDMGKNYSASTPKNQVNGITASRRHLNNYQQELNRVDTI